MKVETTSWGAWRSGVAMVAMLAAVAACDRKPDAAGPPGAAVPSAAARTVRVTRVESRPMEDGLTASGLLVSREEAAVGSDLSGYRVAKVYFEQGAWVKAGQPLVQLDDSLLRAQIDQAVAQAEQASAQAKRVAGLDDQGVLPAEQIETRRIQAKVQAAAVSELRTRQAHMTIRAPVSGLILERNVRPGDIASAGGATPMFRIVRDGLVELNAELAEDDMAGIHIGDPAQVVLPGGSSVQGRVRLIDPQVDAQTKLGRIRVGLPVRADLRPGGFGRAIFTGLSQAKRAVPETAVRYDADGASVAVVGADNRVSSVPVKTGGRAKGYVELTEGPPAGSRVLLRSASFVLPGDKVQPVETAPAAEAAPPADVPPALGLMRDARPIESAQAAPAPGAQPSKGR